MKGDYGLTSLMVIGAVAFFVFVIALYVLPLLASVGARISAIAS